MASLSFQSAGFWPNQIDISALKKAGSLKGSDCSLPLAQMLRPLAGSHSSAHTSPGAKDLLAAKISPILIIPGMILDISALLVLSSMPRVSNLPKSAELISRRKVIVRRLGPGAASSSSSDFTGCVVYRSPTYTLNGPL